MKIAQNTKTKRISKILGASSLLVVLGLSATACGMVESFGRQTADAWSVTYEVSVTGGTVNGIDDVKYLEAPTRGEVSSETAVGEVATTNDPAKKRSATWQETVMVTAEEEAGVSAAPRVGATATCRVLLDGVKEIAAVTGEPGKPVECAVSTPAFAKK
ncbi:hypothetical protein CQ010_14745 [Arthrobacter sp. MYb211]|uniref:hypothetical protein n=1 Tax=unclassified Arthrobacter TaxID=235627 RepID=UPI000CFBDAA1|nr:MULTISPECIES: hypothetical protein [unclassified Arthrobacter]PRA10251.1 hypothetical protein CQ015_14740 [Arthrobacter sp. MYb221]PRC05631.1 hypothetical protein CQ010_14745 [Arthrobacter sp. MYb211]